jgi:hypothetical protein
MHRLSRQPDLWCFIEARGIGVLAQTGQSYRHTGLAEGFVKQLIFFALVFPPGVMDLLLFQARPTGHDFASLTGVE